MTTSSRRHRPHAKSVLVGFGRAGRDLHFTALLKIHGPGYRENVVVVDPLAAAARGEAGLSVRVVSTLEDAGVSPEDAIVHVCTPPATHAEILVQVMRAGFRHIIVEKPLATSQEEVQSVVATARATGAEVLVLNNWLSSALTNMVREEIARGIQAGDRPSIMRICSLKSRIGRSLRDTGHRSIFEVEIPHMIALSVALLGEGTELLWAHASDLYANGHYRRSLGTANVLLSSVEGTIAYLHSDLTSPIAERSVRVQFAGGGFLVGYFPCTSMDHYSQLLIHDERAKLVDYTVVEDDTLCRFLEASYDYFECRGPKPQSDLTFNEPVCALLDRAKSVAAGAYGAAGPGLGPLSDPGTRMAEIL